jgi:hypothetical protein
VTTHVTNEAGSFVLDSAGQKIRSIFGMEVDYIRVRCQNRIKQLPRNSLFLLMFAASVV